MFRRRHHEAGPDALRLVLPLSGVDPLVGDHPDRPSHPYLVPLWPWSGPWPAVLRAGLGNPVLSLPVRDVFRDILAAVYLRRGHGDAGCILLSERAPPSWRMGAPSYLSAGAGDLAAGLCALWKILFG